MCHGPELGGGPPVDEGAPPAPNIAGYAAPGVWTETQFINTIRTGVTPSRKKLNGEIMPWEGYARMTDEELLAIDPCVLPRGALPSARERSNSLTRRQPSIFSREEVRILTNDPRVPPDRRMFYALLLLTGMRHGEAAGRRWRASWSSPPPPRRMVGWSSGAGLRWAGRTLLLSAPASTT